MNVRNFALILGIVFTIVGVAGFIPGLVTAPGADDDHHLVVSGYGDGYLLGLFHVNILHSLVHLAFGIWGIVASKMVDGSVLYARAVAVAYLVLAVAGLIPGLNTMFGLIPIHGNDVWLHLLIGAAAAYFGFVAAGVGPRTDSMGDGVHPTGV